MSTKSKSEDAKSEPITFTPPFDDADADLIIHSSDDAYFSVIKPILRRASPVFANMFDFPPTDVDGQTPVVDLTEDKKTILALLHLCYPLGGPSVENLDEVSALMGVCEKYSMEGAQEALGKMHLRQFLEQDPLRVYALAVRARCSGVAEDAARQCLHKSLSYMFSTNLPDFRHISAPAYHALLSYYHAYGMVAASVITCYNFPWVADMRNYCWGNCQCRGKAFKVQDEQSCRPVQQWWVEFLNGTARSLLDQPEPTSRLSMPSQLALPPSLSCNSCNASYLANLNDFLPKVQEQVEAAVARVSILPFARNILRTGLSYVACSV